MLEEGTSKEGNLSCVKKELRKSGASNPNIFAAALLHQELCKKYIFVFKINDNFHLCIPKL